MAKGDGNRILIGSLVLSIAALSCIVRIDKEDLLVPDAASGDGEDFAGGFEYSKTITISNPGGELSDYDVLVEVDTASLISNGEMKPNCDDMRFLGEGGGTPLLYWLEQGCDTSSTQIWVRVPMIPGASTVTVIMLHGNISAGNESAPYAGSFIVMSAAGCPGGWSSFSPLNDEDRFPRGSTTYGGTGGTVSHSHTFQTETDSASNLGACEQGDDYGVCPDHTHTIQGDLQGDNLPPFGGVVFCSSELPVALLPSSLMMWAEAVPGGWRGEGLFNENQLFPRGSDAYGGMGGHASHAHAFSGTTSYFNDCGRRDKSLPAEPEYEWSADCPNHFHDYSGMTWEADHLPPYLDSAVVLPESTAPFEQGLVVATTSDSPPPLGWDLFGDLNDGNRFPRGCTDCGGSGGSSTHTHDCSGDTDPDAYSNKSDASCGWAHKDHTHHFEFITTRADHEPPYLDVVFVKRKTVSVDVSVET